MCVSKIIFVVAALVIQHANSASINTNGCICTREYLPICGSDSVTYSNDCMFQCEKLQNTQLEIRFYGDCDDEAHILPIEEDDCLCTQEFAPVCGNDDQTYPNECTLKCTQHKRSDLILKHIGECGKEVQIPNEIVPMDSITEQCVCVFNFEPVCGTDGNTYSNECELDCEKRVKTDLEVRYPGECKNDAQILSAPTDELFQCACPLIYLPVCGTDDTTYSNECDLNCSKKRNANLNVKHQGRCDGIEIFPMNEVQSLPIIAQQCVCPLILRPVCGSDGQNYDNECLLNCARKTKSNLTVKHFGRC